MTTLPTQDDVLAAYRLIAPYIVRTPILRSALLDEETGAKIFIKPEPLQRTGSFKLRGATNALRRLDPAARAAGVVAFSSGNHGQAVACAAAALDIPCTIVMPSDAPAIKRDSTARWGARIVSHDRRTEDRAAIAAEISRRTGATLIPPYDHPDVIAGQGTLALELVEDARASGTELDLLFVCTGGGGMTAGCALALEALSPETRLIAVEPEGWDDTARSLAAGTRLPNDGTGSPLCDSLMSMEPGELTFAINQPRLAAAVVVEETQIFDAIAFALNHLKLVAEPGGAVALAAARSGSLPLAGLAVGVVISGGNADPGILARALATS